MVNLNSEHGKLRPGAKALVGLVAIFLASICFQLPFAFARGIEDASSSYGIKPPQALLNWDHSAQDITLGVQASQEYLTRKLDAIGNLKPGDCTFESVFLAIDRLHARFEEAVSPLLFYIDVSPSKDVRDAANEARVAFENSMVDATTRNDVFNAMVAAEKNIKSSGQWERLLPDERRVVDKAIFEGKRLGLALPDTVDSDEIEAEIEEANVAFNRNLAEDTQVMTFAEDDLKGVPREVLSTCKRRKTDDGAEVYDVTFRKPDFQPILEYADKPHTRQKVFESSESHLPDNVALLDKGVELKRQYARSLGYKSWVDYVAETRTVKGEQNIKEFLDAVEEKLRPLGFAERDILLQMKQKDYETQGLVYDGTFYNWDYDYYARKHKETSLDLDHIDVKEYFPVSSVVPAVLDIYSTLFGIEIKVIEGASTWHSDVQAFAVWEQGAKEQKDFLGYFYLDLYPRDGKYNHAKESPILRGYEKADGRRQFPVCAMITNFARAGKTALIPHSDVATFFHEMGHIFHHTLVRNKFWQFSGIDAIDKDFVEAPSQMLENWIWEPTILEKISSHYETHKPLPADLIEKVVKSRYMDAGLFYLRQTFYAQFDLQIHTEQEAQNHTKLWNDLREDVALTRGETPGQSIFPHLMSDYAGAYYGYMYSLVFAADMYATVFKADPLSPTGGRRYREKVLSVGASRDPLVILKDFLGRKPNNKAFFEHLNGFQSI